MSLIKFEQLIKFHRIKLFLTLYFCFSILFTEAQICGTPGKDGTKYTRTIINTYFPPPEDFILIPGSKTITLDAVPSSNDGTYNFGITPIRPGDLLLIIEMQDATIHFSNDIYYGGNSATSGPDLLGGTGYTDLGNSGKYEYIVATNSVPLTGGTLTFRGAGSGRGTINQYINAPATTTRGTRTFQVVRIPQYSNLTLINDISSPTFNGKVGGIIVLNVAGKIDFNGYKLDATGRGFEGGLNSAIGPEYNDSNLYAIESTNSRFPGKGTGIAGTPLYGFPLGSCGKGAPANAGGAGNKVRAGGGGGGNGGAGGVGGNGLDQHDPRDTFPNGGRPGTTLYDPLGPDLSRLMMGGSGGGGELSVGRNPSSSGGIVLINAKKIIGNGLIVSNGLTGCCLVPPQYSEMGPGGDGGGAGGTVFINLTDPDPSAHITIQAKAGNGGGTSTQAYPVSNPGPGGGGGGGQVFFSMPSATITTDVSKGLAGKVLETGSNQFAEDGQDGHTNHFTQLELPPYLRIGNCFPEINTTISAHNNGTPKYPGSTVTYLIKTTNTANAGNAGGVQLNVWLPSGFSYSSATVTYTGDASGPNSVSNISNNLNSPAFGDFNLFPGDTVAITLVAHVGCDVIPAIYNASAQVQYLDPSRTVNNSDRRITPFIHAFAGSLTTYETDLQGPVPGNNYDGNLPAATSEDITIEPLILTNNTIQAPKNTVFCLQGDPGMLHGNIPVGGEGSHSYQWQQSRDNLNYTDIPGALLTDYDPPQITDSTYYRRNTFHLNCSQPYPSNVVLISVVGPLPVPGFQMPDICLEDGIAKFINQTTLQDGAVQRLTYLWDFGDDRATALNQNTSTDKDPSHVYTRADSYNITLQVKRDGVCTQTIKKTFRVNGSIPKAAFNPSSSSLCSGQQVTFEDKATVNFGEITKIELHYDDDNDPTQTEIDLNPEKRAATPRVYQHSYPLFHIPESRVVMVRMVVYSGKACKDELLLPIVLKAVPEITFGPIPSSCNNAPAFRLTQATETSGTLRGTGIYSGPGVNAEGLFTPSIAGPGEHTLTYNFTANNGCTATATQKVTVFLNPSADAGKDLTVLEGGLAQLLAEARGSGLNYKWTPSTFLDRDDVLRPVSSPTKDIIYKLTVTNGSGCLATDEVLVRVLKNPEIPNTFTPNGDNINDEWNIKYLSSYPNATIAVYNRYGEKVFHSTGQEKSWDGKKNGQDMPVGTYYYVIDPHDEKKVLTGFLTILR